MSPRVRFVVQTSWLLVGPLWVTLAVTGRMPSWTGFPFLVALVVALYHPVMPGRGDRMLNVALTVVGLFVGLAVSEPAAVTSYVPWLDLAMSQQWSASLVWSVIVLFPMHIVAELLDI